MGPMEGSSKNKTGSNQFLDCYKRLFQIVQDTDCYMIETHFSL